MMMQQAAFEQGIKKSLLLWYDVARQGCTNYSMAERPVLRDLSGNGHDATCYNFGWTEGSGISTTDYPGALVSDGVDDYAITSEFRLGKDWTLLFDVDWMEDSSRSGIIKVADFYLNNTTADNGTIMYLMLVYPLSLFSPI